MKVLLWHQAEAQCRIMMLMPGDLCISHMYFVVEHPRTLWYGTESADMEVLREVDNFIPWCHNGPEQLFTDRFVIGY